MKITPMTRGQGWQTARACRREKPLGGRPPDNPYWEKFPEMEDREKQTEL